MKIIQIILVIVLSLGYNLIFGQNNQAKKEYEKAQPNLTRDSILYVLRVDDRSLEFNPGKNEKLNLETIDPNSIESISVLKGKYATDKYGDKGQNGVLIITFRNFNLLSEELQSKFTGLYKK